MGAQQPIADDLLWQPADEVGTSTDANDIAGWIDAYGQHPLAILLSINGGELFVCRYVGGVGFFRWGKGVLVVGGALTSNQDHVPTLTAFLDWCDEQKLVPRFVHFCSATAAALATLGFKIDQLGASYSLAFEDGNLSGKEYQQVRRKLNKARRLGVTIERIEDARRYSELVPRLRKINRQWLRQKGAKHIDLLVCEFDRIRPAADTLVYTAWHEGNLIAYLVFSRTLGQDAGWFHNLSRRQTGCVDGTMQLIVSTLMKDLGSGVIHFGFTPLVELEEPIYPHSPIATAIARQLSKLGGVVYPARSQRQYKVSWCPSETSREFLAYRGNPLGAVLWFLRATNSL
ncbi:MAG: DUF2156 domain-containing protein [Erythrobacter sp.]|nr:DUF2156 domain-containing protein [Erythrobacter sp.]